MSITKCLNLKADKVLSEVVSTYNNDERAAYMFLELFETKKFKDYIGKDSLINVSKQGNKIIIINSKGVQLDTKPLFDKLFGFKDVVDKVYNDLKIGKNIEESLLAINETTSSDFLKTLAESLIPKIKELNVIYSDDVTTLTENAKVEMGVVGQYNLSRNVLTVPKQANLETAMYRLLAGQELNSEQGLARKLSGTIVHEALHVLLVAKINDYLKDKNKFLNDFEFERLQQINNIYNHLLTVDSINKFTINKDGIKVYDIYGMSNLNEFVSEIISNSEFRKQLNNIILPDELQFHGTETSNNILQVLWDLIKSVLNIESASYSANNLIVDLVENLDITTTKEMLRLSMESFDAELIALGKIDINDYSETPLNIEKDLFGNEEFILPNVNLFFVEPRVTADKKAKIKASRATKYIGFGEGIMNSSTELYRQQIGEKYANTSNYKNTDIVFVSVPGKRGEESIQNENINKIINELDIAIEAKSTIIKDSESYLKTSDYNTGEKLVSKYLLNKGYIYREIIINNQSIGVWTFNKLNTTDITINTKGKEKFKELIKNDYPEGFDFESIYNITQSLIPMVANLTLSMSLNDAINETFLKLKNRYNNYTKFIDKLTNNKLEDLTEAEQKIARSQNITTLESAKEYANTYKKVLDIQTEFNKYITDALVDIGFTSEAAFKYNATETEDNINELEKLYGTALDEVDMKSNASPDFKLYLSTINEINKVNGQVVAKLNILGLPQKVDYNSLYSKLRQLISQSDGTFNSMIKVLQDEAKFNPSLNQIVTDLTKPLNPTDSITYNKFNKLRNEFVEVFNVNYQEHLLVTWTPTYSKGEVVGYTFRTMSSNRRNAVRNLKEQWKSNLALSPYIKTVNNKVRFDDIKLKELQTEYLEKFFKYQENSNHTNEDFKDLIANFFDKIGIVLTDVMLDRLAEQSIEGQDFNTTFNYIGKLAKNVPTKLQTYKSDANYNYVINKNSFFGEFFNYLNDSITQNVEDEFEMFNPISAIQTSYISKTFNELAKLYAKFADEIHGDNYLNVSKNSVYAYQQHNQLSTEFKRLKTDSEYLKNAGSVSFKNDSLLLQDLGNSNIAENIRLYYLDGFRRMTSRSKGDTRKDMSTTQQDLMAFSLFTQGMFLFPTMSDRSTSVILQWKRQQLDSPIYSNGKISKFGTKTKQLLTKEYMAEVNRIVNFQNTYSIEMRNQKLTNHPYYTGANYFFLFPYLNRDSIKSLVTEEELNTLYIKDSSDGKVIYKLSNSNKALSIIERVVEQQTIKEINKTIKDFTQREIISDIFTKLDYNYMNNKNGNLFNYKNAVQSKDNDTINKAIEYAVFDFTINNIIANAETHRIFLGDIAQYWSKSVKVTNDGYQKRLSKDLSTRKSHNFINNQVKIATIEDIVMDGLLAKPYETLLGTTAYYHINIADGQQWGTMKEALVMKLANNRITQTTYDNILKKIEQSYEDGTHYYELTKEEEVVFQPDKEVFTKNILDNKLDVEFKLFRKSSIIWLLPQWTVGKPLDELRLRMEKDGVDRVAVRSADKSGFKQVVPYTKKNSAEIDENVYFAQDEIQTLTREGLGIQQDIPIKESKEITYLLQLDRLITEGLDDVKIKFEGTELDAKGIREMKDSILADIYNNNLDYLKEEFGITNENEIWDINNKKLQKKLIKFAKENNWDNSTIQGLELDSKGDFKLNLALNTNANTIEHALTSIIRNGIVKLKMNGASYIQMSGFGLNKLQVEWESLSDKEKIQLSKSIITTEDFNWNEGLTHTKITTKVKPSKIFVTWNFKDVNNKLLDINKFTKTLEDGRVVIDDSKLPKELREAIMARVPTQSQASSFPAEIVGFIPAHLGNVIIAPHEVITQTDADFDIDKLYGYLRKFIINQEGNLEVLTKDTKVNNETKVNTEILQHEITNLKRSINFAKTGDKGISQSEIEELELQKETLQNQLNEALLSQEEYNFRANDILKNRYIDLLWIILNNTKVAKKTLNPLGKDDLQLEANLNTDNTSLSVPVYWSYQRDSFTRQQIGQKLISTSSLISTWIPILQSGRVKMNSEVSLFRDNKDRRLNLSELSNNVIAYYNGIETQDNERTKLMNMSIIQSLAVDYAKNPIGMELNLNGITSPIVYLLTLLDNGKTILTLDQIFRFITQPIIVDFVNQVNENYKNVDVEFNVTSKSEIVKQFSEMLEQHITNPTTTSYTSQQLLDIRNESKDKNYHDIKSKDFWNAQWNVFNTFKQLLDNSNDLFETRNAMIDSTKNGAGKTIVEAQMKIEKLKYINANPFFSGLQDLFYNNKQLLTAFENTVLLTNNVFSKYYPYQSTAFTNSLRYLGQITGRDVTEKQYNEVWKSMKDYILSGMLNHTLNVDSIDERKRLLDISSPDNIVRRLENLRQRFPEFRNNIFIQTLEGVMGNANDFSFIKHNFSDKSKTMTEKQRQGFNNLVISENEEISKFGLDLVNHMLLSGTFEGATSYGKYVDIRLLESLGITENLNNIGFNNDRQVSINALEFVNQYIRNNAWIAPSINNFRINKLLTENNVLQKFKLQIAVEDSLDILTDIKQPPFIYDNATKLLYENIDNEYHVTYQLGGTYISEYYNGTIETSLLPDNNKYYKFNNSYQLETEGITTDVTSNSSIQEQYGNIENNKYTNTASEILNSLAETTNNEAYGIIAQVLSKSLEGKDITIELSNSLIHRGSYFNGKVQINPKKFYKVDKGKISQEEYEEVLLHELSHPVVSNIVNTMFPKGTDNLTTQQVYDAINKSNYSPAIKTAVRNLHSLFVQTRDYVKKNHPTQYNTIVNFKKDDDINATDLLYYGVINLKEFIAEATASKEFQILLNGIKNKDKTILSEFMGWLSSLLDALRQSLGIGKIKGNSILEVSINNIMNLYAASNTTIEQGDSSIAHSRSTIVDKQINAKFWDEVNPYINSHAILKEDLTSYTRTNSVINKYNLIATQFGIGKVAKMIPHPTKYGKLIVKLDDNNIKLLQQAINDNKAKVDFSPSVNYDESDVLDDRTYINRITDTLSFRRSNLERTLTTQTNDEDRIFITDEIEKLSEQIDELKGSELGVSAIRMTAQNHMAFIREVLNKDNINRSELQQALELNEIWKFDNSIYFLTDEQLNEEDDVIKKILEEINTEASRLYPLVINKIRQYAVETYNKNKGRDVKDLVIEDLKAMKNIDMATKFARDISNIGNDIVQLIDESLKNSKRNAEASTTNLSLQIKSELDKVKGENLDLLLQVNDKGIKTGSLVSRYSTSWYEYISGKFKELDKERSAINQLGNTKLKHDAAARYYKDFFLGEDGLNNKTEIIDIRFFVEDGFKNSKYGSKQEYIDYLKKEYGTYADEVIEKSTAFYNKFILEAQKRKITYNNNAEGYNMWIKYNNPINLIKEFENDSLSATNIETRPLFFHKFNTHYTFRVPKNNNDFYDKSFKTIESKENLYKFYQYYTDKLVEFKEYLPDVVSKQLRSNFLPYIEKDLMETIRHDGLKAGLKYIGESTANMFTDTNVAELLSSNENEVLNRRPTDGVLVPTIPILFTQQSYGKLKDDNSRSYDLPKLLEMFGAMAINYRNKADIQDKVELLYKVIDEARELKQKNGNNILRKGEVLTIKNGNLELKASVRYAIEAGLYNLKRDDTDPMNTKIYNNPRRQFKNTKKAKEIENKRDKLEAQLLANEITQEEFNDSIKPLADEYKLLEGKNLVFSKVLDSINAYTTLKGLGLSLTSGITNLLYGMTSNLNYANGRVDFNSNEFLNALGIIMKAKFKGEGTKLINIVNKMNVLFEVNEIEYGKTVNSQYKMTGKIDLFVFQRKTEFMNQTTSLVAQMLHTKTKVNDKEVSLWEAYDKNGNYIGDEKTDYLDELVGDASNKFTTFRNKVIQVNKAIHGNYDPNSPLLAKKYVLGRMLFTFRSWMPEGFATRMQSEHFDKQLGRDVKGRYRTYTDLGFGGTMKTLLKQVIYSKSAFETKNGKLKDVDVENMRRNLSEIITLLSFIALGILVKAGFDDDDDKKKGNVTSKMLLNALFRAEQDIKFYVHPGTFTQIIREPIPALKVFKDFGTAIDKSTKYINKGGEYTGENPMFTWMKALPLTNAYTRLDYQMNSLIEDNVK